MEAGSSVAVVDFVAGAQRAAGKITKEALDQQFKTAQDQRDRAEELMKMVETEKQRIAEVTKGKKRVAAVAEERGRQAGKPLSGCRIAVPGRPALGLAGSQYGPVGTRPVAHMARSGPGR